MYARKADKRRLRAFLHTTTMEKFINIVDHIPLTVHLNNLLYTRIKDTPSFSGKKFTNLPRIVTFVEKNLLKAGNMHGKDFLEPLDHKYHQTNNKIMQ